MKIQNRRKFLTAAVLTGAGLTGTNVFAAKKEKQQLTHHVFFWLKNPDSKEDLDKLIEGLQTLRKIESIRKLNIGIPAKTEPRPVVDSSYSVSELLFFDDLGGQKLYQDHPLHKKFVENCSPLWKKILVYDATDI